MRKEITLAEISLRPGGALDDLNEADFGELFNELPEEPEVDLDEAWIEEQIEISKMLRKEGK